MLSPEWFAYEAFSAKEGFPQCRAQSYRLSEGAPPSFSLRGSLGDQGFSRQRAARESSLVLLLVSEWLIAKVSHGNKVMITEAVTHELGASGRQMVCGPAGSQRSESVSHPQSWSFNTVID